MTPEEFVAKHGFPGTPAGEQMAADLLLVMDQSDTAYFRMRRNCTCSWDEDEANINGLDDQCVVHGRVGS